MGKVKNIELKKNCPWIKFMGSSLFVIDFTRKSIYSLHKFNAIGPAAVPAVPAATRFPLGA